MINRTLQQFLNFFVFVFVFRELQLFIKLKCFIFSLFSIVMSDDLILSTMFSFNGHLLHKLPIFVS